MGEKKAGATQNEMVLQSVVTLLLILVACVDLCDAATVVDVYRLIQYDMSGVPFGSRLASLNHHATSLHFPPGADLSRTVLIIPLRDLNITFLKGICCSFGSYIRSIRFRQLLCSLLMLCFRLYADFVKYDFVCSSCTCMLDGCL